MMRKPDITMKISTVICHLHAEILLVVLMTA